MLLPVGASTMADHVGEARALLVRDIARRALDALSPSTPVTGTASGGRSMAVNASGNATFETTADDLWQATRTTFRRTPPAVDTSRRTCEYIGHSYGTEQRSKLNVIIGLQWVNLDFRCVNYLVNYLDRPGPAARALAKQAAGRPVHGHLSERSAAERAL